MFFLALTVGEGNDLTKCPGYDAFAAFTLIGSHHCVSLATSGLTIGENGAIVSLNNTVNEWKSSFLIDVALQTIGIKHIIESEGFRIFFGAGFK